MAKLFGNIARSERLYDSAKSYLGEDIEMGEIPDSLRVVFAGEGEDRFVVYFARLEGKMTVLEVAPTSKDKEVIRRQILKAVRRLNFNP